MIGEWFDGGIGLEWGGVGDEIVELGVFEVLEIVVKEVVGEEWMEVEIVFVEIVGELIEG